MTAVTVPVKVKNVCTILKDAGFEVYLVGGCVRDILLGKTPEDYDITTNALPAQIKQAFADAGAMIVPVQGADRHGVVFVNCMHDRYEIATFRGDKDYTDGRHCDIVTGVSLEEDLKRRDFTVNAMALNPFSLEVVDPLKGERDLQKGIIRAVGSAGTRFHEDGMRILRMYRFSAKLRFKIDKYTRQSARLMKDNLRNVSMERKATELTKIILCDPSVLLQMDHDGILEDLLPELHEAFRCPQNNPYHFTDVGTHSVLTAEYIEPTPELRWAALLHDLGKVPAKTTVDGVDHFYGHPAKSAEIAEQILTEFKFSGDFINHVVALIQEHDHDMPSKKSVRRFIGKYDLETFKELMLLKIADVLAHEETKIPELLQRVTKTVDVAAEVLKEDPKASYKLKDLAINGDDLISLGVEQGPEIGRLLQFAYDMVLDDPANNSKEALLEAIRQEVHI